jgi:hypothetical protein
MKAIHPRVVALIFCYVLAVAFSSSAQSNDATNAATFANAPVTLSSSEMKPSSDANSSAAESTGEALADDSSSSALDEAVSNLADPDQTQANSQGSAQNQTPPSNNPNPQAPTLEDLGLSASQTQADPRLQARLDKRSHMLKIHQRLGLITLIPLVATVATSFGAGGRSTSTSDRWAHLALGSATGDLYFTTAYFAIFAPRIPGTPARGQIRVHKALAWVHGPGMILTPILGAIAFDQRSKGEKVHGIASAHGAVAAITAGAYGAALLSVSFKF